MRKSEENKSYDNTISIGEISDVTWLQQTVPTRWRRQL